MTLRATHLLSLTVFLSVSSARADIPPPPGFVETCTVETQAARGGGPCESASTFHGGVDPAIDQGLRARGLTPRCTGGGATVGTAVYCTGPEASAVAPPSTPTTPSSPSAEPAPAPAPATPPAPATAPAASGWGCSVSAGPSTIAPLFLLVAAALFRARRSRRAPSRRSTR